MSNEQRPVVTRRLQFRADEGAGDESGNKLVGLAVPFNTPTRIRDYFEDFDEEFAPGAFKRTLSHRTPVLQFDHGTHPLMGSIPLGQFTKLEESKRGLEVEAELFDNWMTEPLRDAIRAGTVDGMSIRFRPRKIEETLPEARTGDDTDVRLERVTEAELAELGPVIFPAYPSTEVDLRSFDLTSEIDRRRLAEALLAGARTVGNGPDQTSGPGTAPGEVGAPADRSGPASGHPDLVVPRRNRRARRLRLHELKR